MGEVCRARDSRLGLDVAVKILPTELNSQGGFRQRFEREAGTIAQSRPSIGPHASRAASPSPRRRGRATAGNPLRHPAEAEVQP